MVGSPFRRQGCRVQPQSDAPPRLSLFGERPDIEVRLDWDFCNGRPTHRHKLHPILGYSCLCGGGPAPPPPGGGRCAASYPTVCIPSPHLTWTAATFPYRNFRVRWDVPNPDPHHFDGNHNGIGCET
jgi:hypothetical protein